MVKFGAYLKYLACGAVVVLLCAGCGGISTMQSVSPLMFFLPGIGATQSTNAAPRVAAMAPRDQTMELAQVK